MKLALVTDDLLAPSQTFIIDKVIGLIDRGLDVHVVCSGLDPRAWSRHPDLAGRPDVLARVHAWPGRNVRGGALLGRTLGRALADPGLLARFAASPRRSAFLTSGVGVRAVLLDLRPDVVHFEFGWLAKTHAPLADLLDATYTASFRGADLNYMGLHDANYYGDVWSRLSGVHCLGLDLWTRAQRRGCPPRMAHALIPPAVDVDRFQPPASRPAHPDGAFRLLTVARLHWKKGFEHGLEAVRQLAAGGVDVRYRIIGSGPHEAAIRACIADLGLAERVVLLGARTRPEVREELATADALLHPATSEGFANAVLEAQAMEVPVVSSDADGLADNVGHGVTGYVVPRRDPVAMAQALATIAADPALGHRLGVAGRRRVATRFRPADQIAAFAAFYEGLAAPGDRGLIVPS